VDQKISDAVVTLRAVVALWKADRGFGFATPVPAADFGDIFIHHSECPGLPGHRNLKKGQEIEFEVTTDDGQRFKARNVRIIETEETR
jgi:cold shock CspA family protein